MNRFPRGVVWPCRVLQPVFHVRKDAKTIKKTGKGDEMLQVELWQVLTFGVAQLTMIVGLLIGAGRMLLSQVEMRIDQRFEDLQKRRDESRSQCLSQMARLDTERREEVAQWQRVERDLLSLRADLPLSYVRREDFVRSQTVVEAKIDAIAAKIETINVRTASVSHHSGENA